MAPRVYFQLAQGIVIIITSVIGISRLPKKNCPERKYILPLCIFDAIFTPWIVWMDATNSVTIIARIIQIIFIWSELFFISLYISNIINRKFNYILPITLFLITPYISKVFPNDPTFTSAIITSIYITYYIYLYFKWLLETEPASNLNKTAHFLISIGAFISYTTFIPFWIFQFFQWSRDFFNDSFLIIGKIFFIIYLVLNSLMYILFLKAFLIARERNNM